MAGCKACAKKKHHKKKEHKKKHHSSSDKKEHKKKEHKKKVGITCACCDRCLCYKYGGKDNWYCTCGCGNCKCGIKVLMKEIERVKK